MTDKPRGFQALSPERRREIASLGGRASHDRGTAYKWDSEKAKDAGRKGGLRSRGGRAKILNAQEE